MKNTEALKKQFMERYEKLEVTELLVNDCIILLNAVNSISDFHNVQEFITKISGYDIHSEDLETIKQILQEVCDQEIEAKVALAHLNYLYDVTCYKRSRLMLMSEIFECFF